MNTFKFKAAVFFTILFGLAAYLLLETVILTFTDEQDLYGENFDIIENGDGGHIVADIYASLGQCSYETTTTKNKSGAITSSSTDYYYIVPAFDKNDETYYICIKVRKDERSIFNTITNNTYDYLSGEIDELEFGEVTTAFEGTIKDLDDELYNYALEWFREAEMYEDEADLRNHVLPLYLEPMKLDSATREIIVLSVLLALTVTFWILFFKARRNTPTAAYAGNVVVSDGLDGLNLNNTPTYTNMPQYNPDPYNTQYSNTPFDEQNR